MWYYVGSFQDNLADYESKTERARVGRVDARYPWCLLLWLNLGKTSKYQLGLFYA